jgi:hypothetical protein
LEALGKFSRVMLPIIKKIVSRQRSPSQLLIF